MLLSFAVCLPIRVMSKWEPEIRSNNVFVKQREINFHYKRLLFSILNITQTHSFLNENQKCNKILLRLGISYELISWICLSLSFLSFSTHIRYSMKCVVYFAKDFFSCLKFWLNLSKFILFFHNFIELLVDFPVQRVVQ